MIASRIFQIKFTFFPPFHFLTYTTNTHTDINSQKISLDFSCKKIKTHNKKSFSSILTIRIGFHKNNFTSTKVYIEQTQHYTQLKATTTSTSWTFHIPLKHKISVYLVLAWCMHLMWFIQVGILDKKNEKNYTARARHAPNLLNTTTTIARVCLSRILLGSNVHR